LWRSWASWEWVATLFVPQHPWTSSSLQVHTRNTLAEREIKYVPAVAKKPISTIFPFMLHASVTERRLHDPHRRVEPSKPMPITFVVESDTRHVRTTATGTVTYDDALAHLAAKQASGVVAWPEIFDARDVLLDFTTEDLVRLADKVREAFSNEKPGPIAFVTNSAFVKGLAESYAALTAEHNPHFKIFTNLGEGLAWISQQTLKVA